MRQSRVRECTAAPGVAVEARGKLIAVENTPERSLSDLLSTSRAVEATTG